MIVPRTEPRSVSFKSLCSFQCKRMLLSFCYTDRQRLRQEERGKRAHDLETAGQGLCLTFKSLTISFCDSEERYKDARMYIESLFLIFL